jgi:beta-galactosidase
MVPWADGHGWQRTGTERSEIPYGKARRGTYTETVAKADLYWHADDGGWILHPGGRTMLENGAATLAWLAGGPRSPTDKIHNFRAGDRIEKQVAVLNDTREHTTLSYRWDAWLAGAHLAGDEGKGAIAPGETRLFPVNVTAIVPAKNGARGQKLDGRIVLTATIGGTRHRDEFEFRVFPSLRLDDATRDVGTLALFDPAGKTGKLLESLGYRTRTWLGEAGAEVLVVGREALSGGWTPPGDLEALVRRGGRVLVFGQRPEWMRSVLGLRVARHVSRRMFPLAGHHPVLRGLDDLDLRDWAGAGTLVEPYPTSDIDARPAYGWRWGNRGSVSSASVEKPHAGSWRPILENEFDLAYSPLMELDYGKGRLILCTLDLEDREPLDPAAERLTVQLLHYAAKGRIAPKVEKVLFVGSQADREEMDRLGLVYEEVTRLRDDGELAVIGAGVRVTDRELHEYLANGRTVFFLARRDRRAPLDVTLERATGFHGSLKVPDWDWTAGLSASDLRWRAEAAAWLVVSGAEIGSDGLLAFKRVGKGLAVFCQIDPAGLGADRETFLRFTRWRSTRSLAQLLANLGARFESDGGVFRSSAGGPWPLTSERARFYHPDYRQDFDLGDDPYRYHRW